jgi:hypothetical protein
MGRSAQESIERKWKEIAEATREEASRLPPGRARDAMMKQVRQLENACHVNEWISSPGLKPPLGMGKLHAPE